MTVSQKFVKRLIGVTLVLLGLISWLALQTPAMTLAVEANLDQAYTRVKFIPRDSGYKFYLASSEAVPKLRIAHLGLRNAGLRSAVVSPSQSQSATISSISPEISLNGEEQNTLNDDGSPAVTLVGKKTGAD